MSNKRIIAGLILLGMLLFGLREVQAGGWAVLTLQSWPDEVVAGEPFTVEYALRQHGVHLVDGESAWFEQRVTAVHPDSGETIHFDVMPTGEAGYYQAELVLPTAGTWQWTFHSFGEFEMPPLTVVAAATVAQNSAPAATQALAELPAVTPWLLGISGGLLMVAAMFLWFSRRLRPAPALGLLGVFLCLGGFALTPMTVVETAVAETAAAPSAGMGKILFVAKGCINCHSHVELAPDYNGLKSNTGPTLSHYEGSAEFLRLWLSDPTTVRPTTRMPNLELADEEIENLIVFLRQEADAAKQ